MSTLVLGLVTVFLDGAVAVRSSASGAGGSSFDYAAAHALVEAYPVGNSVFFSLTLRAVFFRKHISSAPTHEQEIKRIQERNESWDSSQVQHLLVCIFCVRHPREVVFAEGTSLGVFAHRMSRRFHTRRGIVSEQEFRT